MLSHWPLFFAVNPTYKVVWRHSFTHDGEEHHEEKTLLKHQEESRISRTTFSSRKNNSIIKLAASLTRRKGKMHLILERSVAFLMLSIWLEAAASERILAIYIFRLHGDETAKAWTPVYVTDSDLTHLALAYCWHDAA